MYLEPCQHLRWNIFSIILNSFYLLTNFAEKLHREAGTRGVLRKGILKNFAKFKGKYFSFNKVAGLKTATLLIKWLWRRCFPVNFAKLLRTYFLQITSGGCFFLPKMLEKVPYKHLHIVCQSSATYTSNYCSMHREQLNKY